MADPDHPQLYLITPAEPDPDGFTDRLAAVLDAAPVACLRLSLATSDADAVARLADRVRAVAHARDVPLVIERHLRLVAPHGLDGVHLPDGPRHLRDARKALGADVIIGAQCGVSRHDGITAGELGADYVSFGPVDPGPLGTGEAASRALFEWWSEMIEIPVVAEGGLSDAHVDNLAPVTDFLALGPEIWREDDPAAALRRIAALLN